MLQVIWGAKRVKVFTITVKPDELLKEIKNGSRRALAQGLTLLEEHNQEFIQRLKQQSQNLPEPFTIGLTGPPGAGKSTLIESLINKMPSEQKLAVLATDPSSPFTGGALLGDRYRIAGTPPENIFFRSLASRGSVGSIAPMARRASYLLALAGFDWILLESIGSGQNALDIEAVASCIVLVLVPESGDWAQGMKSGILEMADIIVVNKFDRPGAASFLSHLRETRHERPHHRDPHWKVMLLATEALNNKGIDELIASFEAHRQHSQDELRSPAKQFRHKAEIREEFLELCRKEFEKFDAQTLEKINRLLIEMPDSFAKKLKQGLE